MTIRGRKNQTPLDVALERDQDVAAELLLRQGADPSYATTNGSERLFHAVERKMVRVTRFLLENGVDPDPVGHFGRTPLLLLASEGYGQDRWEIAEMLLRTGSSETSMLEIRDSERPLYGRP